jgi:hypothetical protein
MQDQILNMIADFKMAKIAVSSVEQELGFSNGLIGKAAKGVTLSGEKFKKLTDFYASKFPQPPSKELPEPEKIIDLLPTTKTASEVLGDEVMEFCNQNNCTWGDLKEVYLRTATTIVGKKQTQKFVAKVEETKSDSGLTYFQKRQLGLTKK